MTGLVVALGVASAQQPGFKRTELQRGDLSVAGREAVTALVDLPDGGTSGKHTHFGEEIGFVLDGALTVDVEGKAPQVMKAGSAFFIPAGVVHNARNTSGALVKVLGTYIVEKGKPLATPVP